MLTANTSRIHIFFAKCYALSKALKVLFFPAEIPAISLHENVFFWKFLALSINEVPIHILEFDRQCVQKLYKYMIMSSTTFMSDALESEAWPEFIQNLLLLTCEHWYKSVHRDKFWLFSSNVC